MKSESYIILIFLYYFIRFGQFYKRGILNKIFHIPLISMASGEWNPLPTTRLPSNLEPSAA